MDGIEQPRKKTKLATLDSFFSRPAASTTSSIHGAHTQPLSTPSSTTSSSSSKTTTESNTDVKQIPTETVTDIQLVGDTPGVAIALKLCQDEKLTSEMRLHLIKSTLKVGSDYKFPFSHSSNRKYYVSSNHITGRNSCFYFSPSLNGLLCLPCVLFAPDRVGRRSSQPTGRLVSQPLTDFSKLTGKDSYLTTHLERSYHEDAVAKVEYH